MRWGARLDAGNLGHGMDIEYLTGMLIEAMAMVSLGELSPARRASHS